MATLAQIRIYPVKSLDPLRVSAATLLPSGGLEHDRRYALVDERGDFVNGKRLHTIQRLRSRFDPATNELALRTESIAEKFRFHLDAERSELAAWLSRQLDVQVRIIENTEGGFPDDTELSGPTVIGTETLSTVGGWFDGLPLDEMRNRFRANLEIGGVEPFWEDRLLAPGMGAVRFRVGEAELLGMNPCARCIVPTRDSQSGEPMHGFAKRFAQQRREMLPDWAPRERFDHYYRLAVNTRPTSGRPIVLREGDAVEILGVE